jgi:hypothetical protein
MAEQPEDWDGVDALADPEEIEGDVEGDKSLAAVLGDLRFSTRAVSKLQRNGLTPDDASMAYLSGEPQWSRSSGKLTVIGRCDKGRARIILRAFNEPGSSARFDVVTGYRG